MENQVGQRMKTGLVYRAPAVYNLVLWGLYRGRPRDRFLAVSQEVEAGDTVVDLCAGTSLLYETLAGRAKHYQAFDLNERFVAAMGRQGIEAHCCDVGTLEIPAADVVTMSSALYHFHPHCLELLERMRASARKKVVVVEPVRNNANSALPLWGAFARWASRVGDNPVDFHFTPESLTRLLDQLPGPKRMELICKGRDARIVLEN